MFRDSGRRVALEGERPETTDRAVLPLSSVSVSPLLIVFGYVVDPALNRGRVSRIEGLRKIDF